MTDWYAEAVWDELESTGRLWWMGPLAWNGSGLENTMYGCLLWAEVVGRLGPRVMVRTVSKGCLGELARREGCLAASEVFDVL